MTDQQQTGGPALSRMEIARLSGLAHRIRRYVIQMASVRRVHIGPAFSIVEILTTLYFHKLRVDPGLPHWPDRDRFILSKGHGALALYGALVEAGFISPQVLCGFGQPHNMLAGHPIKGIPGVEAATGSLGHGLAVGAGMALAARLDEKQYKTVVLLGDGELNEGSVWEAALFAAHQSLNGLIAVVDRNNYQQEGRTAEILNTEPLSDKWRSFGWNVLSVDGHNLQALAASLNEAYQETSRPTVLVASTIKGKGISYMEDNPVWHMGWLRGEELERAFNTLEEEKGEW